MVAVGLTVMCLGWWVRRDRVINDLDVVDVAGERPPEATEPLRAASPAPAREASAAPVPAGARTP